MRLSKAWSLTIMCLVLFPWILFATPQIERWFESWLVQQVVIIGGGAAAIVLVQSAVLLATHLAYRSKAREQSR